MSAFSLRSSWILFGVLSAVAPAAAQGASAWHIEGGQAGAHLGSSIAAADVNGDGFADLVVGAPDRDGARVDVGLVSVYHGSPAGLGATPDWTFRGRQPGMRFGAGVARAGDVNGDGFDDIIVGAPGWDVLALPVRHTRFATDEGIVLLFLGSPLGLGDFPRSAVAGIERGERFGSAVAGAGDVNGDGFDDMLIGATGKGNGLGGVFLFQGRSSGQLGFPAWIQVGTTRGLGLGSAIAAAGDADADGFDDFVYGLPEQAGCGQFFFVHGSSSSSLVANPIDEALVTFGPAADLAGDGRPELVFGSDGCLGTGPRWRRMVGAGNGSLLSLGAPAAIAAGDMNGDGRMDVVAGLPEFVQGNIHGRVAVYPNRPGNELDPDDVPCVFDVHLPGAGWGEALATADVDGDGGAELFVAAPRRDGAASEEGSVTLIPSWKQDASIEQVAPLAGIEHTAAGSTAAAGIGDFDADGHADLALLGFDPNFSGDPPLEVRYGSLAGLSALAGATLVLPPLDPLHVRILVDFSTGDVNGDGFDDLQVSILPQDRFFDIYDTSHSVYLGSSTGLLLNPAITWTAPGHSITGRNGKIVGDVNADGFDDLVVDGKLHLGTASLPVFAQDLPGGQVFGFGTSNLSPRNRGIFGGNMDGDPFGDVVIARETSGGILRLSVYRGSPSGLNLLQTLQPQRVGWTGFFSTFRTRVLAFRDLDGDGRDDLLIEYGDTSFDSHGQELALFHGSATGLARVSPWWDYALATDAHWIRPVRLVVDADHDGFQDLLLQDHFTAGTYRLHRGSAAGILRTPASIGTPDNAFSAGIVDLSGDFDGDGRPEFTSSLSGLLQVFEVDVP